MDGPSGCLFPDGRRLHLQHGPIDLVLDAAGEREEIAAAYATAQTAFATILEELVKELPLLRSPCTASQVPQGAIARRMHAACLPHARQFITPMAAVAGSVADHMLEAAMRGRTLRTMFINNGGDIAIHLADGESLRIALCTDPWTGNILGQAVIPFTSRVRGVATSGWRGRSFSLGVADMVTVLACDAAAADAAATMIANAVDPGPCPQVSRQPACELAPDSDLGEMPVTVDVQTLSSELRTLAAERGLAAAQELRRKKLIDSALIVVQGEMRIAGKFESDGAGFAENGLLQEEHAA